MIGYDAFYTHSRIDAEAHFFEELPESFAEMALADPDEYGGIERVKRQVRQGGIVWRYAETPFNTSGSVSPLCPFVCSDEEYVKAFTAARSARFEHRA